MQIALQKYRFSPGSAPTSVPPPAVSFLSSHPCLTSDKRLVPCKMANSAAKKIHRSNQRRLRLLFGSTTGVTLFHGLVLAFVFGDPFPSKNLYRVMNMIFCTIYGVSLMFLWSSARAQWDPSTGALLHAGHDLSAPGLLEYIHDIVYVTLFTHALFTFTRWALIILLVALIFGIYMTATQVFSSLPGRSQTNEQDDEDDLSSMSRKERRKVERKSRNKQR